MEIIRAMTTDDALAALSALSQRHRLAVFRLLVRQGALGACPGDIGAELGLSPATLSFHLRTLNQAGLIVAEPQGRSILYRADFNAMGALVGFLGENCCAADGTGCEVPATVSGGRCPPTPPHKESSR
jgi:ArsR family transcriptional regulator